MRLLHTTRLEFEDFFDDQIPSYAILSHRWGPDEVSYQDFLAGRKRGGAGYAKILACCKYAACDLPCFDVNLHLGDIPQRPSNLEPIDHDLYGWVWVEPGDWVWIDTCCINKSSSAELSEAINSMYDWYRKAHVCYAYLSDVIRMKRDGQIGRRIGESQWFRRGWTLQELLAPAELVFLDKNWVDIGTRKSRRADISQCTKINSCHIAGSMPFLDEQISVAEKLSWASRRVTSRREDWAYCLLGLFSISIPLLYGEGEKSFDRLQGEIIRSSNDESIFLWDKRRGTEVSGRVLADSVGDFSMADRFRRSDTRPRRTSLGLSRAPFAITNQGLEFRVPKRVTQFSPFLLPLSCPYYERGELKGACAIMLQKDNLEGLWVRNFDLAARHSLKPTIGGIVRRSEKGSSVYVVPVDWVWSRESLAKEESEVIYLKISR